MAQITRWHILGAGSIGCLWAFYLQKAGHRVSLLARDEEHQKKLLAALPLRLLESGVTLSCAIDAVKIDTVKADNDLAISNLLVCVKAWQTKKAIEAIKPFVSADATIVLMQNGMGNQQWLTEIFPHQRVYAAITTEAACRISPLLVEHTGSGMTWLGTLSRQTDSDLPEKLGCELKSAAHPDIEAALWQKLVINCCINPLTVIHQCRNGDLATIEAAQQTIREVISECRQVATVIKKPHYLDGIEAMVAGVIEKTARNTSSMRQDILNHQPTEIDYMNGYIASLGERHGIDTPVNRWLAEQIKAL